MFLLIIKNCCFSYPKSVHFSKFLRYFLSKKCVRTTNEINNLEKQKHGYLLHTLLDKDVKGSVAIRALPSVHEGLLDITFIPIFGAMINFSMINFSMPKCKNISSEKVPTCPRTKKLKFSKV